ncbi:MAG: MFS transporter, partial [Candidatus Limnocylindria bacterium]|nr:MFS transporter [Candidatus Limnocylindria bacterium]
SVAGLLVLLLYSRFGAAGPAGSGRTQMPATEMFRLFRLRVMWLIGAIQFVRLGVGSGLGFWLPTFLVVDRGQPLQFAGLVVAMGAALAAPSNFLGGYISDRIRNPLLVVGVSQTMLAIMTFLLARVDSLALLIAVIAVTSVFLQFYFGPLFSVPIEMFGPRSAGLTSGFGNLFANVGGFVLAYTLGSVRDTTGSFAIGFYVLSALCLCGLACTVTLWRTQGSAARRLAGG